MKAVVKNYQNELFLNKDKDLYIDYCSYKASEFSVYKWHYSKSMPSGKLVRFGVWEKGNFIGCVIFGTGANMNMSKIVNLTHYEVCELVRVALDKHKNPVSKIVSYCLKKIKKDFPNLKAIISYADPRQNHTGKIYQAMNWIYLGVTTPAIHFMKNGKFYHSRTVNQQRRDNENYDMSLFTRIKTNKHKYIYLYDKSLICHIKDKITKYPCVSSSEDE